MGRELKYKITYPGKDFENEFDFLETLLIQDGIEEKDIQSILHPTKKFINDPFLMKNMDKAIEIIHDHVEKGSKILIRVDSDCDGFTSSSELIQFLWELNPDLEINFVQDFEKHHGLVYENVCDNERDEYGLIIIPDASMGVNDARIITNNFDAEIVVLDHHLIEPEEEFDGDCYTNYCTAVNCTDGEYPNPCLSGCGVVQKFIEGYVDKYNLDPSLKEKWLDLVSASLISDSMSLKSLENRYYVMEGLKKDRQANALINEIDSRTRSDDSSWQDRCIKTVGWSIAPLINGCIRWGTPEEQVRTFQAICGWNEDVEYQPRRKHKEDPLPPKEIHTLQWDVARNLVNVKAKQDRDARKFTDELIQVIEEEGLDKNSVIVVDGTKVLTRGTVTGLIANKLASKYMRPIMLMRSKNAVEFGGSMRGYDRGVIENTKEFLESTGFIKCHGHSQASGITINKSDVEAAIQKCNELMPLDQMTTVYTVDWEIPAKNLRREYVQEVGENYKVFGGDIPSPTFLIKGIEINASEIQAYGESKSFIRFTYNGIPFIKKFCAANEFDEMTCHEEGETGVNRKRVRLDIIGEFTLSLYENTLYPQVKIVDFGSEEIPQTTLDDIPEITREIVERKSKVDDDEDFDW